MSVSLDKKARNLKRVRNFFRTIGFAGLGLAFYSGISSSNLEKPENYEKYTDLKSNLETIDKIQSDYKKLENSNIYTPSIKEIKSSYGENSELYNQSKNEIKEKIENIKSYEIRRYDEKKDVYANMIIGRAGILVLGLMGSSHFDQSYKYRKHYLKAKKIQEKTSKI